MKEERIGYMQTGRPLNCELPSGRRQEAMAESAHHEYDESRATALACGDRVLLDAHYSRLGVRFGGRAGIVEFGSSLTGGSDWLADGGPLAITDLVASKLAAASERLRTRTRARADIILLRNYGDIDSLPPCDLLYSALSTTCAPTTVLMHVLGCLLSKVAANGVALLHLPTQHTLCQLMLEGVEDFPDLHVIPQWKIFELFETLKFSLILVQENPLLSVRNMIYHTILAQRRVPGIDVAFPHEGTYGHA
jgi:hypothetical protein